MKVKSKSELDEDGDRTVWQGDGAKPTTNATADCTAVLAFASTIYRDFDSKYAERLISAAKRGWAKTAYNAHSRTSGKNFQMAIFLGE